ncbi:MAG TPA: hypothetical protein DEB30_02270 [Candidatus Peribacter riflensis]|uniref:Uncharacterized protein n=1 Tax=Candidatus Peribacter riflensis TaxID=1735162 RepID=A0A0S1SNH6_9BACT|nr:MAG: hypothetical protein PeribacterA2_0456 [Candidatus Peribacter riflensis]OGJ79267.1 MAG: hypothetical protein A2398_00420 [Candidatus Peribacteria bacterium RIFOXYB1_FULL_57_12]OGJ80943.1 MAG: hypothetical protein A2412_01110 [Candidatus Peribacteria bacterium RIFOXYC1_FULL_58_8]ALM10941.1 MAG: hypothetical protein PeribacterB2_0455 [Candidatus Peribacter riflensis]ALM12044.1 MAG: hypothetical protein PeribacterC2_0455 [Candidatus Peribacter riflensis]
MKKPLVLKWDNMPHTFVIRRIGRILTGILTIRKPRGVQQIRVRFPQAVTLAMIDRAWKKQHCQWLTVTQPPHGLFLFLAVRKIRLPQFQILWYVLHINDAPYDACCVLSNRPKKPKRSV